MRILLALALLLAACQSGTTATSTPLPSSSVAAPARPLEPAPTALDERFGIALTGVDGINLRTEDDVDPIVSLKGLYQAKPSPDGKQLAYWQIAADLVPELVIYHTLTGALRRVYALTGPAQEYSQTYELVWSPSSDRIAFIVRSMDGPAGEADPPAYQVLRIVSLADGAVREVLRRERSFMSIESWREPDRLVIHLPGLFPQPWDGSYQVVREDGAIVDVSNDWNTFATTFDDRGRYAIVRDCVIDRRCILRVERRSDPRESLVASTPAGQTLWRLVFRPRSSDLVAVLQDGQGKFHLERWDDGGRGAHIALAALTLDRPQIDHLFLRPDGSAAMFLLFDSTKGGRWYGDVVDLASGRRSAFEVPHSGNPIGLIRLRLAPKRVIDLAPDAETPYIGEARARWIATRRAMGRISGTDVRLTTYADAIAWAKQPAQVGSGAGSWRQPPRPSMAVYVVVVQAPFRSTPRRGPAALGGPAELCTWFYAILDATDGTALLTACPRSAAPSELPPVLGG